MNNDPLVEQMKATLAQRGYTAPTSTGTPSSGSDWYSQIKQNAPEPAPTDNSFMGALTGKAPVDQQATQAQGGSLSNPIGTAKAFAGGSASGVGATLPLTAIDYAGKKAIEALPDNFQVAGVTKQQMLENLSNSPSLNDQYKTTFGAQEHPTAYTGGEVAGVVGSVAPELAIQGGKLLATEAGQKVVAKGSELINSAKGAIDSTLAKQTAKKSNDFIKDLVTPELNNKATVDAIKTGKVTEGAGLTGERDITNTVSNFKGIQKAVSEVPNISPKNTLLENTNAIHDHIGTIANDLVSNLKKSYSNMKVSDLQEFPKQFDDYMAGIKSSLKENPTLVGDSEKTATKILDKFNSLVKESGVNPEGLLSARQKLDSWMASQKGSNIFDPKTEGAVSVSLRSIRQGGNDFLSKIVPDVKVKDMLAKQTNLYNAIEHIAPKAAKEGATSIQQFVKSHPNIVKAGKYGLGVLGLGAAGEIASQKLVP